MDVLPAKENEIPFEHQLDLCASEVLADGAAVLVIDDAARMVHHLPPLFPSHVSEVCVFQIEGSEQLVKTTELEKFSTVEGARSAAAIEARVRLRYRLVDTVPDAKTAILPPTLRETRFLAQLGWIAEEDLAGDGEHPGVCERFQQRLEEIRLDAHIAIEQDDDVVLCGFEAGVGAAAETAILFELQYADGWKALPGKFRASIRGGVVDNDDLVAGIARGCRDYRWQMLLQQIATIPVRDDDGCGCVGRRLVRRQSFFSSK